MIRFSSIIIVLIATSIGVAGCSTPSIGGGSKNSKTVSSKTATKNKKASTTKKTANSNADVNGVLAGSVLIINGQKRVTGEPVPEGLPKKDLRKPRVGQKKKKYKGDITKGLRVDYVIPRLNSDGTINDGADPFSDTPVELQRIPIEGDPNTTLALDSWAKDLSNVSSEQWQGWLDNRSPLGVAAGPEDVTGAMVKIFVEKCGGARSVSTGVVLADETVATTVHAIESTRMRVRVQPFDSPGSPRLSAMIKYLDVDDDVAILSVPGLRSVPIGTHSPDDLDPQRALAFGVGRGGGLQGNLQRVPVVSAMQEEVITLDQPDGLDQQITHRYVYPILGGVDNGFSGGVVVATNDPDLAEGWGFHGLLRARVPFRSKGGGIAVPSRIVQEDILAALALDTWFELKPTGCPQWYRPRTA